MRRARFFPFIMQNMNNDDGDEDPSERSYNFIADEEQSTFIDHIHRAANVFRNFDDYEALLNLDDNIIQSVPEHVILSLPTAKFTENNKENFSEENKSCTICMYPYEIDDEYLILPCLHRFHTSCIKEWLGRRNTCPNCKDRINDHYEQQCQPGGRLPRCEEPSFLRNDEQSLRVEESKRSLENEDSFGGGARRV